jgi:hypothetical protein
MKPPTEIDSKRVASSSPRPCSPLLGKRVRATDGNVGTIVEIAKTHRYHLTVFHVQTDDEREAALFSHEFEVLKANA